jgi:hypothetical protein
MVCSNMGLAISVARSSSRVANDLDVPLPEHNVGDAEGGLRFQMVTAFRAIQIPIMSQSNTALVRRRDRIWNVFVW